MRKLKNWKSTRINVNYLQLNERKSILQTWWFKNNIELWKTSWIAIFFSFNFAIWEKLLKSKVRNNCNEKKTVEGTDNNFLVGNSRSRRSVDWNFGERIGSFKDNNKYLVKSRSFTKERCFICVCKPHILLFTEVNILSFVWNKKNVT